MNSFAQLNAFLDPALIWAFRLAQNPQMGFFLGCVYVALCAVIVGDVTMSLAYRVNRKTHLAHQHEMLRHNDMSFQALACKDKRAFKACNTLANDAFGKSFFLGATLFCASIWPAALALGWLDQRFGRVEDLAAPFIGHVRPEFWFIPIYIAVRIIFSRFKHKLPVYRLLHAQTQADQASLRTPEHRPA